MRVSVSKFQGNGHQHWWLSYTLVAFWGHEASWRGAMFRDADFGTRTLAPQKQMEYAILPPGQYKTSWNTYFWVMGGTNFIPDSQWSLLVRSFDQPWANATSGLSEGSPPSSGQAWLVAMSFSFQQRTNNEQILSVTAKTMLQGFLWELTFSFFLFERFRPTTLHAPAAPCAPGHFHQELGKSKELAVCAGLSCSLTGGGFWWQVTYQPVEQRLINNYLDLPGNYM